MESSRLTFRRFELSDLPLMRELESDLEIMKFSPSRIPQSADQSRQRLTAAIEKQKGAAPYGVWAAELKTTGDFVGWFMLAPTTYEAPELGFMLPQRQWGFGYATEAAGHLIKWAFEEQQVSQILAATDPDNVKSQNVLTKLGFSFLKQRSVFDKIWGRDILLNLYQLERPLQKN